MFRRPLNSEGLPKNRKALPGLSRSTFHFVILKKTISIWPVPSSTITLRCFDTSVLLTMVPCTWTYARSPRTSRMGVMDVRSM